LTTKYVHTYGEHRLATLENQRIRLSKSYAASAATLVIAFGVWWR